MQINASGNRNIEKEELDKIFGVHSYHVMHDHVMV